MMMFNVTLFHSEMQVNVYKEIELIKSGGVEIRGLKASAISRRKPLGEPVLEKYLFYPQEDEEVCFLYRVDETDFLFLKFFIAVKKLGSTGRMCIYIYI